MTTSYNKELSSSATVKDEQFGFDIFADNEVFCADDVEHYCDGADAMWNELASSVTMTDELISSVTMAKETSSSVTMTKETY